MRACLGCRRTAVASGAALAMLVAMPSAKAILQSLTATGALTAIEPGSLVETALGLQIGDPFLAVAVYDDALLSGLGSEAVELNPTVNPGSSFGLNIADVLLFDETDEVDFGSGFPQLEFVDGTFDRFNFISSPFDVAGAPVAVRLNSILEFGDVAQDAPQALGAFLQISQAPVSPD
jgi:hypothetical protein